MPVAVDETFRTYFAVLRRAYGPQRWWPARSRFEVIVGAILTQNTAWTNVEKGLAALRRERLLHPGRMHRAPSARLARLIRPTGYFNQKAARLKGFVAHLHRHHGGSLARLLAHRSDALRAELLTLHGIGPETADAIVLYAARKPVFVVDSYARRVFARHALLSENEPYERLRRRVERALPPRAATLGEYHALLVNVGKVHCRKRIPRCSGCPLEPWLPAGGAVAHHRPPRRR